MVLCRATSCYSADKQIYLVDHSRIQDMDETKTTAVLPGVTGLTDLPDQSEPENYSCWLKEETNCVQKVLSQCIHLRGISWGHVLQAVRNSSII